MGPVPQPEEDRDRPGHNNTEEIEDAEYPDVIINAGSDSDDDDDYDDGQDGYGGYQALSQNVDVHNSDTDSESDQEPPFEAFQQYESMENTDDTFDDNDTGGVGEPATDNQEPASGVRVPDGLLHQVRQPDYPNVENLPNYMQVPEVPRPEKKELLWNQPRNSDHMLDIGHADKIKSVMSGIRLPSTNIPDWALNLSDDQWQSQIVNKLVNPSINQIQTKDNSEKHSETEIPSSFADSSVSKDCEEPS